MFLQSNLFTCTYIYPITLIFLFNKSESVLPLEEWYIGKKKKSQFKGKVQKHSQQHLQKLGLPNINHMKEIQDMFKNSSTEKEQFGFLLCRSSNTQGTNKYKYDKP